MAQHLTTNVKARPKNSCKFYSGRPLDKGATDDELKIELQFVHEGRPSQEGKNGCT